LKDPVRLLHANQHVLSIYYVENLSFLWMSFKRAEPLVCDERLVGLVSYLCHALLLVSKALPTSYSCASFLHVSNQATSSYSNVEEDVGNFRKGENFRENGSRQEHER